MKRRLIFTLLLATTIIGHLCAQKYKNHILPFDGLKGQVKSYEQISYKVTDNKYNDVKDEDIDRYYVCQFDENGMITKSRLSKNKSGTKIQDLQNKIVNGDIVETIEHYYIPENLIYKTKRISKQENIEKWVSSYTADRQNFRNSYTCQYLPDRKIWTDTATDDDDIQLFDSDGHLISRTMYSGGKIKQQYIYRYNEQGFVCSFEVTYYNFQVAVQRQVFKYEGEDSHGNWKRRITYDDGIAVNVMEQSIEYNIE